MSRSDPPLEGAARLDAYVSNTVASLQRLSEDGVLAAGQSLQQILSHARAQAEDLAQLGAALNGENECSVGVAVASASQDMVEFVNRSTNELGAQQTAIKGVQETMTSIVDIGRRIDGIAAAARFLALNAVIEANRLGAAGNASRVIAGEMKELSSSIEQANSLVASSASRLLASIPDIVESINGLLSESAEFSQSFKAKMVGVDGAFRLLDETARRAQTLGDERLSAIVNVCNAALAGLQFQDPMAQLLTKITQAVSAYAATAGATAAPSKPTESHSAEPSLGAGELALF